jgi:cell fate (sporulation/competence/biofilm development) regulator YlbF (YheA/YmcA/DUF963 family)
MDDLQELMDKAGALGQAIAAHPRMREYNAAREAVEKDADAQSLLRDYAKQAERIRELERNQKPVEVADKQKLAEIEGRMAGNDAFKRLMRCQADYVELMNQVNRAMEAPLVTPSNAGAAK